MARKLNWDKDYQSIMGTHERGVRFIQDNYEFDAVGDEVLPAAETKALKMDADVEPHKPPAGPVDYQSWHFTRLRTEMERRGQTFDNKTDAVAWLLRDDNA